MLYDINKEELFSAIRGLNLRDFTERELDHLRDLFHIKGRQIEEELIRRKSEGK